jgi:hypothetical protein
MTTEDLTALTDYLTRANEEGRIVELSDFIDWQWKPDKNGIPVPDKNKPIYTIIRIKIRNT